MQSMLWCRPAVSVTGMNHPKLIHRECCPLLDPARLAEIQGNCETPKTFYGLFMEQRLTEGARSDVQEMLTGRKSKEMKARKVSWAGEGLQGPYQFCKLPN